MNTQTIVLGLWSLLLGTAASLLLLGWGVL